MTRSCSARSQFWSGRIEFQQPIYDWEYTRIVGISFGHTGYCQATIPSCKLYRSKFPPKLSPYCRTGTRGGGNRSTPPSLQHGGVRYPFNSTV
jgi:hypothetical protein